MKHFSTLTVLSVVGVLLLASNVANAGSGAKVSVEIPRLTVAEYHPPYVAVWVAGENHQVAANLAVWYQRDHHQGEGEKWLKDLRQWWRRSGRSLDMPVDGFSGATRRPGKHGLDPKQISSAFARLTPGTYQLIVEVAREVGGREVQRIDFQWPPDAAKKLTAQGSREMGEIVLQLTP